jgi:hypothetical protein
MSLDTVDAREVRATLKELAAKAESLRRLL